MRIYSLVNTTDVLFRNSDGGLTWTITINEATLTLIAGTTVTQTSQSGTGTIHTAVRFCCIFAFFISQIIFFVVF